MTASGANTTSASERLKHWDAAYKKNNVPPYPSQFAVFACDYLEAGQNIIEFGCGSGRDSIFFAWQGYNVSGFDGSEVAVEKCRKGARKSALGGAAFERLLIEGDWDAEKLDVLSTRILTALDPTKPTMVYARFFLHILTSDEQRNFLDLVARLIRPGSMGAFEFRTHRDQGQSKIAQPHYRRYINPVDLVHELTSRGFEIDYFIESFGLAKYKVEDAHVARVIFFPSENNGPNPR